MKNSTLDLSGLTSSIVNNRSKKKIKFTPISRNVDDIKIQLATIADISNNKLWTDVIAEAKCEAEWNTLKADIDDFQTQFNEFISTDGIFTQALKRLERDYVNVGAVGITREGKSQFTKSVTGLNQWVIPTRAGKPCTTAPINVINGFTKNDNKTGIVRVYYYTIGEMVNLLHSFLCEIAGKNKFSEKIKVVDSELLNCRTKEQLEKWCKDNKKVIYGDKSLGDDYLGSKKLSFLSYLANIDIYISHLIENDSDKKYTDYNLNDIINGGSEGSESKKINSNLTIAEEYYSSVSYYKDPVDNEMHYTSYATKHAEVYTSFKVGGIEVSNLQFLDTPGIGEQKPGLHIILTDAISMKLDIILIVRAVETTQKNKIALEELIGALKSKFDGKHSSKDIIYFILNIWDGVDYKRGQEERKEIKELLSLPQSNAMAIDLDDSHFRMINLSNGIELKEDGSKDSNTPLTKYLRNIFESIIPYIEEIDNDFCKNAEAEYQRLSLWYETLLARIKKLGSRLPNYSDYGRITNLIESFHKQLNAKGAKLPEIMETIKYPIDEFCNQNLGYIVGKLFNSPTDNLSYDSIDDWVKQHSEAIASVYDEGSWNLSQDFLKYEEIKGQLCDLIKDDIKGRIDQSYADNVIEQTKKEVAETFIEYGKLTMLGDYSSEWWDNAITLLSQEPDCDALYVLFKNFGEYKINVLEVLKEPIERVAKSSRHFDDFGADNDFQEYKNACISIVHSLLKIEDKAKNSISEGRVKQSVDDLEEGFKTVYSQLIKMGGGNNPIQTHPVWRQLYGFYERHSAEVFTDDSAVQKRGLTKKWKSIYS